MLSETEKNKITIMLESQSKYKTKKELWEAVRESLIQSGLKIDDTACDSNEKGISIRR